jgi:hypothetical protein
MVPGVPKALLNRQPARITVIPPSGPIQTRITSPAPSLTYPEKYRINFSGSVFDPQFGDVPDQDVSWISDGGSAFATGKSVTFGGLVDGKGGRHCPSYVKGWEPTKGEWVERIYYAGAADLEHWRRMRQ